VEELGLRKRGEGIAPEEFFMEEAIKKAKKARTKGDYAIGAVLVQDSRIIAACGQRLIQDQDPTGHAEILAIRKGSKILRNKHLIGCVLYSTCEPCPMCAGAAALAKVSGIIYGARMEDIKKNGIRRGADGKITHRIIAIPCREVIERSGLDIEVIEDFMRDQCLELFH